MVVGKEKNGHSLLHSGFLLRGLWGVIISQTITKHTQQSQNITSKTLHTNTCMSDTYFAAFSLGRTLT